MERQCQLVFDFEVCPVSRARNAAFQKWKQRLYSTGENGKGWGQGEIFPLYSSSEMVKANMKLPSWKQRAHLSKMRDDEKALVILFQKQRQVKKSETIFLFAACSK